MAVIVAVLRTLYAYLENESNPLGAQLALHCTTGAAFECWGPLIAQRDCLYSCNIPQYFLVVTAIAYGQAPLFVIAP